MYNIGIIGAGKVGVSLGRYLSGLDYTNLVGYYSRSLDSSAYAAKVTNSVRTPHRKIIVRASQSSGWASLTAISDHRLVAGYPLRLMSAARAVVGVSFGPRISKKAKQFP